MPETVLRPWGSHRFIGRNAYPSILVFPCGKVSPLGVVSGSCLLLTLATVNDSHLSKPLE